VLNRGFGGYNSTWYVYHSMLSFLIHIIQDPTVDGPYLRQKRRCPSIPQHQTGHYLARSVNFSTSDRF